MIDVQVQYHYSGKELRRVLTMPAIGPHVRRSGALWVRNATVIDESTQALPIFPKLPSTCTPCV
jgi:hypothetical protein